MKRLITLGALSHFLGFVKIAIITNIATVVMIQPASAQVLELGLLAGTALNALFNNNSEPEIPSTPQPLPERKVTVGTDNLNGNNFNFSLFPDPTNFTGNNGIQFSPIRQNSITNQQSIQQSIPDQGNPPGF